MKASRAKRKPDPTLIDRTNPEWTKADFARARPASDVLPKLLPKEVAERLLRPRGRPKTGNAKKLVSLRLSAAVLDHFKSTGAGWQTRIDETLRKAAGL
ncbi:MAG: BrnA antitoxin family protein [Hyphomicrobium sp.]